MNPDFILERYIPDLDAWHRIIKSGLSPRSPGEAEAIKREMQFLRKSFYAEIHQLETWYWDAERIEEAMSIPIDKPQGKDIALPQNVGIGFHLFRKTDKKGKEVDVLYADVKDGSSSILPMAIIIRTDKVQAFHNLEDGSVDLAHVPKGDLWFMLAARMTCFLNQKLTDVKKVKALTRQERRRIGMESPESQTEINLVRWRKIRYESNGTEKILRDKCWPVMGHVRWQWYPSDMVHKPIWIETHIRGNPNAPLHVRTRINSVVN